MQQTLHNESYPHHALLCSWQPRDMKKDPRIGEAKNLMRRKRIQLEHQREYDEAIVTLKQKVNGRRVSWRKKRTRLVPFSNSLQPLQYCHLNCII